MDLPDEIVLLHLLPYDGEDDGEDAPIRCETSTVALSDNPTYEALSYVWGNPTLTRDVEVSGCRVSITDNLYAVLHQLRLPDRSRALWIDQLCIDQTNNEEKARQIKLMRKIYSTCSCCLLWLGKVPPKVPFSHAQDAIDLLKHLAVLSSLEQEEIDAYPVPASVTSQSAFQDFIDTLWVFYEETPWFTRIWTVQEAALPAKRLLLWGPLSITWETIMQACDTWIEAKLFHEFDVRVGELTLARGGLLGNMFCAFIWLNGTINDDAIAIVLQWRSRHATQPQDKIFGLLGLLGPDTMNFSRSCDYLTPVAEVFCCLTLDLILEYCWLFPLMADSRFNFTPDSPDDVPSWAWNARNTNTSLDLFFKQNSYRNYNAAAGQDLDDQALMDRAEHTRMTLELTGVKVDTVEFVGQASFIVSHPDAIPSDFCAENMRAWYALAKSVLGEEGSFTTPQLSEVSSDSSSGAPSPELLPQSPLLSKIPSVLPSPTLSASATAPASSAPPSPSSSSSSSSSPLASTLYCGSYSHREAFGRLMLGDFIRLDGNSQEFIPVDEDEDVDKVYQFMDPEQCECGNEHYSDQFLDTIRNVTPNQRFFTTKKGLMGLGHRNVRVGDEVWIFNGGNVPFLLRPREEQEGESEAEEEIEEEKESKEEMEGEVEEEEETGEKETGAKEKRKEMEENEEKGETEEGEEMDKKETENNKETEENEADGEEEVGETEESKENQAVEEEAEEESGEEESGEEESGEEESGEEKSEWEDCPSDDDDNEAVPLDYDFVGACNVQGIMQGEAFAMEEQLGELEERIVHLH